MYLFDTNVLVSFLRGDLPHSYAALEASDPRLFRVPAIVRAELLLGAEKSARPEHNRRLVEQLLLPFESVPFDERCAGPYARVRATLERKGKLIGPNDLVIAATALAYDAVLITNNVGEFKRVPGLSVESWEELGL